MGEHLDPARFHGFISGTLTARERDSALAHLDGCPRCRNLLSTLVKDAEADGPETLHEPALPVNARTRVERPRPPVFGEDRTAPGSKPLDDTDESRRTLLDVPRPSDQLVGQRLGDYMVQDLIAKGGMGAVYKGVQPVIGKQVAIKVLLTSGPTELNYAQRMLEEARTVNAIGHPNIIDIFGFGELPDGRPWLVMEYLDGLSVSQWVRARPAGSPAPVALILEILEQSCAALEAVHKVGAVHRDLKPANIMLVGLNEPRPRVKVLDFGFAKSRGASLRTSPDVVLGTPGFMSPEQIQGEPATLRSDLYALGLCAWFMLEGVEPYQEASAIQVLQSQLSREPPALDRRPGVPPGLAALVASLTRINPALRPASASEVRERLQQLKRRGDSGASSRAEAATIKDRHQPAPDLSRTEPDRASVPLSKSQVLSVRPRVWPWVLAVGGAVLAGLSTWLVLR